MVKNRYSIDSPKKKVKEVTNVHSTNSETKDNSSDLSRHPGFEFMKKSFSSSSNCSTSPDVQLRPHDRLWSDHNPSLLPYLTKLILFGFGNKWCSWIKACLNSSRASILINGSPTSEFSIKHGLRQGDPLSPFLFVLVIEGLHNAFEEAVGNGMITGVNINNSTINVSYLFYADDVIITTNWNARDMENIIRVLHVFYLASGLKINIYKSNIYGIGVNEDELIWLAMLVVLQVALSSPNALWLRSSKLSHGQEGFSIPMVCSFKGTCTNIVGVFQFPPLEMTRFVIIIDRINNGQWFWNWSRINLGVRNLAYLRDMLNEIDQLNIDVNEDTCTWSLGPNGTFTVKDARYRIDQNILPILAHATTWDKSIPERGREHGKRGKKSMASCVTSCGVLYLEKTESTGFVPNSLKVLRSSLWENLWCKYRPCGETFGETFGASIVPAGTIGTILAPKVSQ
ncbi:RNA-directed DNA polymerase, eukaryota, reverse transcriptase zinc-binding domain protein [Tanacetum coccineum]